MFRSDMQVELLSLLFLQSDRTWTLGDLNDHLQAPQSSIHRELHRLVDAGLARRDARQRPHSYRAATDAPAFPPLRELLELTAGVPLRLAREFGAVAGISAAAIHGSWAAGTIRPDSDLDVIVVTEGDRRAAQRAVRRVGQEIDREVDASVLTRESFDDLRRSRNPFLGKVLRGPRIDIVGDLTALGDEE
jgi:predicted nucleotidyltransferase